MIFCRGRRGGGPEPGGGLPCPAPAQRRLWGLASPSGRGPPPQPLPACWKAWAQVIGTGDTRTHLKVQFRIARFPPLWGEGVCARSQAVPPNPPDHEFLPEDEGGQGPPHPCPSPGRHTSDYTEAISLSAQAPCRPPLPGDTGSPAGGPGGRGWIERRATGHKETEAQGPRRQGQAVGEPSFTFCATLRPVPGLGKGVQLRRPRTCSQGQGDLDTGPWHCWLATELVPRAAFIRGHEPGGGSPAWGGWGSPRVLGLAAPHPCHL